MGIIDDVLAAKKLEDLDPKPEEIADSPKEWTTEKAELAIGLLVQNKGQNPVAIAREVGVKAHQIKELWAKVQARIAELTPDPVEPVERIQ